MPSKFPSRRRSEKVISGHHCCKAAVADLNDCYMETARCGAFGQELTETTVC
jgi:hypothetical protein